MQPVVEPGSKPSEPAKLDDCLLALLRGIQQNLGVEDAPDGGDFRAELAALEKQFTGPGNARQIVESAVEVLSKYGTQASQAKVRQTGVLAAGSELASAIQALPGMQGDAERWNRIEQQIKSLTAQDNLEATKARLVSEIAAARAEALQESQKLGALFSGILGKLDIPSGPADQETKPDDAAYKADPLTGLPLRALAEIELTRVHGQPTEYFLALFVVKRLALINARFGYARGDEVLMKVVQHLAQLLSNFNNLFRWAPCAFLTVAPPDMKYPMLRSKVQTVELARLTPTLEWEGRSAMVPVAIDCRIVAVKDFATITDLFLRLDTLATDA
jgi:GGDEF domain-containing protein